MDNKITLLNAPTCKPFTSCTPPLGVSIVQRNLKKAGFDVSLNDLLFESKLTDTWGKNKIIAALKNKDPNFIRRYSLSTLRNIDISAQKIGISVFFNGQLPPALALANYLTKQKKEVFLGGNLFGFIKEENIRKFLPLGARIFSSMEELFIYLGKDHSNLEDFPDFNGLNLDLYKVKIKGKKELILPFLFRRGCNKRCTFCIEYYREHWKSSHDTKSLVENAVKEIKRLSNEYSTKYFFFADCSINNDIPSFELLIDKMRGLGIKWGALSNICGLRKEFIKKMKESGCQYLIFGIESGSNRILKLMRKSHNIEMAEAVLRSTKQAGIFNYCYFVTNFPGETIEDHRLTKRFIVKNSSRIDDAEATTMLLSKGSYIQRFPEEFGILVKSDTHLISTKLEYSEGNKSFEQVEKQGKIKKFELDLLIAIAIKSKRYLKHPFSSTKRGLVNIALNQEFPLERLFEYS